MKMMSLVLGLSLVLTACEGGIPDCEKPVSGSRSDVTLEFENPVGFSVTECPKPGSAAGAFLVRGTASDRLYSDRAPDDLALASDFGLRVVSRATHALPVHTSNVLLLAHDCDPAAPSETIVSFVYFSDWAFVDAAIEKIGQKLNEEALGEQVIVGVHQEFCED